MQDVKNMTGKINDTKHEQTCRKFGLEAGKTITNHYTQLGSKG